MILTVGHNTPNSSSIAATRYIYQTKTIFLKEVILTNERCISKITFLFLQKNGSCINKIKSILTKQPRESLDKIATSFTKWPLLLTNWPLYGQNASLLLKWYLYCQNGIFIAKIGISFEKWTNILTKITLILTWQICL